MPVTDIALQSVSCRADDKRGTVLILCAEDYLLAVLSPGKTEIHVFESADQFDAAQTGLRLALLDLREKCQPLRPKVKAMRDGDGNRAWGAIFSIPDQNESTGCSHRLLLVQSHGVVLMPRLYGLRDGAVAAASEVMDVVMGNQGVDWLQYDDVEMRG